MFEWNANSGHVILQAVCRLMPIIRPLRNVHKINEWWEGGQDLLPVRHFTGCHPQDLFFENAVCIPVEFSASKFYWYFSQGI